MRYVGIDWATDIHRCALVEESGEVKAEWPAPSDAKGLAALIKRLNDEGGPSDVLVSLEPGAPLLVDQLLAAGFTVYAINPKQADRFRDRFTPAGAKDDKRDAIALAGAIRTDRDRLKILERDSDLCEEIRLRDRARSRKVTDRTRLANQLRQVLSRFFPAILKLGRDMHDPFFLTLLHAYPDPERAARARSQRLEKLIGAHRLRVLKAKDLRELLGAPRPSQPTYVLEACRDEVRSLVTQIRVLNQLIDECEAKLDELMERHPDHEILRSLPGLGNRLIVRVIAELGDRRERCPDYNTLQAIAGTAPVTKRSGKRVYSVRMRKGCNRTLQSAMFTMARCSLPGSTWATAYYKHQRAHGMRHSKAIRSLSNKWAKILWAVLAYRKPYDEQRHLKALTDRAVPWAPDTEIAA